MKLFTVCEVEILQITVNKIEVFSSFQFDFGRFSAKMPKIAKRGTLVSC